MSQLAQDDNGDILITNNRMSLVDGQAEVRQRLIQNLRTFLEEWFLDVNLGLPYLQLIFQKGTPPNIIEDYFKNEIINTVGVTELKSFDPVNLLEATRELEVKFSVSTPFSAQELGIEETV